MTTIVEEAHVVSMMWCVLVLLNVLFVCCPCSRVSKVARKVSSWGVARSIKWGNDIFYPTYLSIDPNSCYFSLIPTLSWFPCFLLYLTPMEDKHIMDASIVASLQEDVFNDIARWNKIFVKWGSVRYHLQSQASQVPRQEDPKTNRYRIIIFC
jgi:hypothetical protein